MIYPLLPVYLARVLGASAISLGIIEGVAEGVNSLLKIASGWLSDRFSRRRPIVIIGYAISSAARPLIAVTSAWTQVLAIRVLDRTGKGIRTAPRDAMLAGLATPSTRGRVFGFHRAMDHGGAIVGPIVATVFLFFMPDRYRLLFALTAIPGALAVATLFLVHEDPASSHPRTVAPSDSPSHPRTVAPSHLPRPFFTLLGVIFVFSLGNSADAFLLLRLGEALGSATYIPLLWAALHVVKASLSTWGGALSDRVGRTYVIALGWAVYAVVYVGFAMSTSSAAFISWFLLYGIYFALTEGSEKALIADLAPSRLHGAAFGLYNAALGIGALSASVIFGILYDRLSPAIAFITGASLAAIAVILLLINQRTDKD
jgi:MFS family permease